MTSEIKTPIEAMHPWVSLRLPPFPNVAIRLLQLTNDENVQLHQLSDLIASDAAFASEVLTIANSAWYAPRFPACTIQQAIAVVGANHLQGMCLTVGVRSYLGKSLIDPVIRRVWHHNLACAVISERLAASGFMNRDAAYTAGLLHDVGRLALIVMCPKASAQLLSEHRGTSASILDIEAEILGCDHCSAGAHFVAGWNLSCDFNSVVQNHHAARRADGAWSMEELIKVSCKLADTAGFSAFAGCATTPFADLRNELPKQEQRNFPAELSTLVQEVKKRISAIDCI